MWYLRNQDLPEDVRKQLPEEAQEIYRQAFNCAWKEYEDYGASYEVPQREAAQRAGWSAVSRDYEKHGGQWVSKEELHVFT